MPNAQTKSLIAALPLPALFIDAQERISAANEMANVILGEWVIGRHYITSLRQPSALKAIETCYEERAPQRTRYLGSDGRSETRYEMHCAFLEDGAQGVLVTFRDVTALEQSDQQRSDFVANVSHELRTPLTAVMGFIETLQGPAKDDPKATERFLGIMADETSRMNRLVDDLLSLSRVEAQERSRPTEQVAIAELLSSVVNSLDPLAKSNASVLTLNVEASDLKLRADSDQMRQVFVNLIENALKYGGDAVKVTVALHEPAFEARLRGQGVRISIKDTGAGFDPLHIPRLTERFYRIDSHRSREMGGTGLGLAIVKHIINRHRGRLEVQSEIGQGSEFTVVLPV